MTTPATWAMMTARGSQRLPLDAIRQGERHRRDLGDIPALARSISEVGLLNPITVTPDFILIAGARRLAAVRQLGWAGSMSPVERRYIRAHRSAARQRDAGRRAESLRAAILVRQERALAPEGDVRAILATAPAVGAVGGDR